MAGKVTMTEKWYGTQYELEAIPDDLLQRWRSASTNPVLAMPKPNQFIPQNLELCTDTVSIVIMHFNYRVLVLFSLLKSILDVSEWFPVNVGLRQYCVMFPCLFSVYMDGVFRDVNVRVLGKGLELLSANGGRFEINQLLFA